MTKKSAQAMVTTAAAAKTIGVSVKTITRWVAAGALTPSQRLPGPRGAYLFDPAVVEVLRRERDISAAAAREPWDAA